MLFTLAKNIPMRTPMDELWYYNGIFSSSGGGSSIGSGCDLSYEDRGEGISCGEGSIDSYFSNVDRRHVSIGFGQGYGTGSGKEYEYDDRPECIGTPFVWGFMFNEFSDL